MLEIVQSLLEEHRGELVSQLTDRAGFSADEAQSFLPPALGRIAETLGSGGFDLGALLGGGGVGDLISKLDVGALAGEAGVEPTKARSGLEALVPLALSLLRQRGGDDVLGKLTGGGGAAGALGSLAGKLFNR